MSGLETGLWRALNRILLVLAIGVLGLLLGLGPSPDRIDSTFGVLVVLLVSLPAVAAVRQMSPRSRKLLRQRPRQRPLFTATAAVLGGVSVLVLWWAVANALFPGTLSPLSLALVGVALAAVLALIGNLARRL